MSTQTPRDRPDPEALLKRAHSEDVSRRKGKLKIFFGFAPGVGKTYRMLQAARALRFEQQCDVVVGVVETHKRSETEKLLEEFEILPRRAVNYRGHELKEFDLDAALARNPQVLLLDELAHSNVPGSRHAKRWQDAMDLLEAGVDVYTTLNVQHVESLNDVVAQITCIKVRETVPDSVLDQADTVELVDITPDELLIRLNEGKVYVADQAAQATQHFFRRGNLLALRELALRRTAQHVDDDVLEYREQYGVASTWPARERILVCVGPAPSSARLLRSTYRMASSLHASWIAVYAESLSTGSLSDADRSRLESHLRLAESLGARVQRLSAVYVADAILDYARKQNVTRIVVGKSTHSRLRDLLRGSLLDALVRGSGDMDVHVITGERGDETETTRALVETNRAGWAAYGFAFGITALTTLVAGALRSFIALPDLDVLYLIAVMLIAMRFGRGPSIATAVLGILAYDFFFVPPAFTLAVKDTRYFLTFAMMFGSGLLLSELTGRIRRQEQYASEREARTSVLYAFSRELTALQSFAAAAEVTASHAANMFESTAFVVRRIESATLKITAQYPVGSELSDKELSVAQWSFDHHALAGLGTDTLPASKILCLPLEVAGNVLGVLVLKPRGGTALSLEQREFLDTFVRFAAFAFERIRLASEARLSAIRAKTEEIRSSLLSTVSHDLRTPLAVITGAATSLRNLRLDSDTRSDLVETICEEAERLEQLVTNLLYMTRLESGSAALKRDWIPLEEVIGSALGRVNSQLLKRDVSIRLEPSLPLLSVDPILFELVFINLLGNIAKHTPEQSPIEISAEVSGDSIVIDVSDRGPGLDRDESERVFEKFYRGRAETSTAGSGLGLAICRAIIGQHNGSITALPREGGGCIFRIRLPITHGPSLVSLLKESALP